MAVKRRLWRWLVLAATGVITTVGVPAVSSASSAAAPPNCAFHCYVQANYYTPIGLASVNEQSGIFTVPNQLWGVKNQSYSIGQIALINNNNGADIELGWVVAPAIYHNHIPHLFVFFRAGVNQTCEEGIPGDTTAPVCPLSSYTNLPSSYFPGMAIGGAAAYFEVDYSSQDQSWYVRYQDQYFGKMSESWWPQQNFTGGDNPSWYGEIATPNASYPCTPMGNGVWGSRARAATISNLQIGTGGLGSPMSPAPAILDKVTRGNYWDSNLKVGSTVTSSFSFGGPYSGPNPC